MLIGLGQWCHNTCERQSGQEQHTDDQQRPQDGDVFTKEPDQRRPGEECAVAERRHDTYPPRRRCRVIGCGTHRDRKPE